MGAVEQKILANELNAIYRSDLSVPDGDGNLIIESDNLLALNWLRVRYAGQVRIIYIDPPYNVGGNDLTYQDAMSRKDWLAALRVRLEVAKELMTADGAIFVSIDDNEYPWLVTVMEEVFPGLHAATFVWKRRSGANDTKGHFVSLDHEYVVCYANKGFTFAGHEKDFEGYDNYDAGNPDPWKRGDLTKPHTYLARKNSFFPIQNPENGVWYPANPKRVWNAVSERTVQPGKRRPKKIMEQLIAEHRVLFPIADRVVRYETLDALKQAIAEHKAPPSVQTNLFATEEENTAFLSFWVGKDIGFGIPGIKRFKSEVKRSSKPVSTWITNDPSDPIHAGMTQEGTRLVQKMLGGNYFSYPKPLSLITSLLRQASRPTDIILDFYAGSGTTAHAVLQLNEEDSDSRRKFILVSRAEPARNEPSKNICRDITRKRVVAAINGYSYREKEKLHTVDGLGGGFDYYVLEGATS